MSYVIAAPEMMTSAATDLATIGSDLSAAHLASVAPTVSLIPAAADEVSAAVTHLFSRHAANYQAAAQAAAFQEQFVQHLHAGAFSYASIEAAIAAFLQNLTADVNGFCQHSKRVCQHSRKKFELNAFLTFLVLLHYLFGFNLPPILLLPPVP